MADLRGQQLKDSYQDVVTDSGSDLNGIENGNGLDITSRIVSRGSNSNGEFVRFANGTQICSKHFLNSGGISISGAWTYPQPFHLSNNNRRTANREIFKMASGTIEYNGDGDTEGAANNYELDRSSLYNTSSPSNEVLNYILRWNNSIASGRSADATITAIGRWK